MKKAFPKILIIGQTFDLKTGGGITLSSLFKNWPPEKLILTTASKDAFNLKRCNSYYRLGNEEDKRPFPFNYVQRKVKSGVVGARNVSEGKQIKLNRYSKKKRMLDTFIRFSGFSNFFRGKLVLSKDFINWVKEEKPDIIYTQMPSYKYMLFQAALNKQFHLPYIIHIMDDWISVASVGPIEHMWFKKKLNKLMKKLVHGASGNLSISDYMASEYKARYGKNFKVFHNPVDLKFWHVKEKSTEINQSFRIFYTGRIGLGISESLLLFANAVSNLNKSGYDINFTIQTKLDGHPIVKDLAKLHAVNCIESISYDELPVRLSEYDTLLLPYDFDKKNLAYIKYSMPTKATEFMATGIPIFIFGPAETAIVKKAKEEKWANICTNNNLKALQGAILEHMNNKPRLDKMTLTALDSVKQNYLEEIVINDFQNCLKQMAELE